MGVDAEKEDAGGCRQLMEGNATMNLALASGLAVMAASSCIPCDSETVYALSSVVGTNGLEYFWQCYSAQGRLLATHAAKDHQRLTGANLARHDAAQRDVTG